MKFCSNCGHQVELKIPNGDNRERHICLQCDTIHYQNPRIIAGVIPVYGEQILLCKRAIEPRSGLWTLPAGFLENGETTAQGAVRECFEESLAEASNAQLYAIYDIPQINQVYIFYRAELTRPRFAPTAESTEVALFHEQDIPWQSLAFPVIELALHHYLEDRLRGSFSIREGEIRRPWKSPRSQGCSR